MSWAATARQWSARVNDLRALGRTGTEEYEIAVLSYLTASAAHLRELQATPPIDPPLTYPVRVSDVGLKQIRDAVTSTDTQPEPPPPTPPPKRSRKAKRAKSWTTAIPSPGMAKELWDLFSPSADLARGRFEEPEGVMEEAAAALHEWRERRRQEFQLPITWEKEGRHASQRIIADEVDAQLR